MTVTRVVDAYKNTVTYFNGPYYVEFQSGLRSGRHWQFDVQGLNFRYMCKEIEGWSFHSATVTKPLKLSETKELIEALRSTSYCSNFETLEIALDRTSYSAIPQLIEVAKKFPKLKIIVALENFNDQKCKMLVEAIKDIGEKFTIHLPPSRNSGNANALQLKAEVGGHIDIDYQSEIVEKSTEHAYEPAIKFFENQRNLEKEEKLARTLLEHKKMVLKTIDPDTLEGYVIQISEPKALLAHSRSPSFFTKLNSTSCDYLRGLMANYQFNYGELPQKLTDDRFKSLVSSFFEASSQLFGLHKKELMDKKDVEGASINKAFWEKTITILESSILMQLPEVSFERKIAALKMLVESFPQLSDIEEFLAPGCAHSILCTRDTAREMYQSEINKRFGGEGSGPLTVLFNEHIAKNGRVNYSELFASASQTSAHNLDLLTVQFYEKEGKWHCLVIKSDKVEKIDSDKIDSIVRHLASQITSEEVLYTGASNSLEAKSGHIIHVIDRGGLKQQIFYCKIALLSALQNDQRLSISKAAADYFSSFVQDENLNDFLAPYDVTFTVDEYVPITLGVTGYGIGS